MTEKLDLDALEKTARNAKQQENAGNAKIYARIFNAIFDPDTALSLIARIRELEDDRDSWAEQASQRVADWQREHDLRVAAERRVGELERASQTGGGEADTARMVAVMDLTVTMSGTPPAFTTYAYGSVFGHPMPAGVFTLYARGDAIDAARAAMGGKE